MLLPGGGLRRGSTVSVLGSTSLVLALLAEATQTGSWAAIVGMPDLGLVAARELGVDLDRLALIPVPGAELVAVLSALGGRVYLRRLRSDLERVLLLPGHVCHDPVYRDVCW